MSQSGIGSINIEEIRRNLRYGNAYDGHDVRNGYREHYPGAGGRQIDKGGCQEERADQTGLEAGGVERAELEAQEASDEVPFNYAFFGGLYEEDHQGFQQQCGQCDYRGECGERGADPGG